MKALTLYQPWASLVAIGAKTIETRSWMTDYRGPLLIHAGKRWTPESRSLCLREPFRTALYGPHHPYPEVMPLGVIVALCTLSECRAMPEPPDDINRHFGNFGPGRYGWILADVRPLPTPVPWPGERRLWDVPEKLADLVVSQVGEV